MVLKRDKISKPSSGGYLFCNHCGGYYKLEKNESPRDFIKCECGNPLEYCKNKKILDLKIYALHHNKKVLDSFETTLLERREALQDIFPQVDIDDSFIDALQNEEGLWDILDRETNALSQKKYLDIILEEERLMSSINQKKASVRNQTSMDKVLDLYHETDPIIILGVLIVFLIFILILTVYRG